MPRNISEFRVVVASPSDVLEFRKVVFDAISEVDRVLETRGVAVRGLGWEEYAIPGVGKEAQEVISHQILSDYDILIALFGVKLGSPTHSSPSGTVEEIRHSIMKSNGSMGAYRTQVYFKDSVASLSDVSMDELAKLASYRRELADAGVFYKTFRTAEELRAEARSNIERSIQRYLDGSATIAAKGTVSTPSEGSGDESEIPSDLVEDREFGLLDHMADAEDALQSSVISIDRIAMLINEIAQETNEKIIEVERLAAPSVSAKIKRDMINKFADFLKLKSVELSREALSSGVQFAKLAEYVIAAAALERQDGDAKKYKDGLSSLLAAMDQLLSSALASRPSMSEFRAAVENLPRITIQFNQAKKALISALDECLELIEQIERSVYEIAGRT